MELDQTGVVAAGWYCNNQGCSRDCLVRDRDRDLFMFSRPSSRPENFETF